MWIVRNQDGTLTLHNKEPMCMRDGVFRSFRFTKKMRYKLSRGLEIESESSFPTVTFENSPMEVDVKLFLKGE